MIVGTQQKKNKVRGFNLIEIAIVLAVIGIIVGGIYVAASSVYENNRKQKTMTQMLTAVQNISSAYSGQPALDGAFSTTNLITARILPADMVSGTTAAFSPYGAVTITSASAGTQISMAYAGLSAGACTDMLMKTIGTDTTQQGLGVVSVAVNSSTAHTSSVGLSTAAGECAGGNATVTILFSLRG